MDITQHISNDLIRNKGYLRVSHFFEPADMNLIEASYTALISRAYRILDFVEASGISFSEYYQNSAEELVVVPEKADRSKICRMEYLLGSSEKLANLMNTKLQSYLEQLMGNQLFLFKDKCNLKLPGGGKFEPHQDVAAYKHFPPVYNLTVMIALDNASLENGCVQFASNYLALSETISPGEKEIYHGYPIFKFDQKGEIASEISGELTWEAIPLNVGDIVIFDHFVPHFSTLNESRNSRRAIFITYSLFTTKSWYEYYYELKRREFDNPIFHVATPTLLP